MKKSILEFILPLFLFSANLLSAQSSAWCGTDNYLLKKINSSPQSAQQWQMLMQQFSNPANPSSRSADATTVYIPIVFHIVHNGDAIGTGENITDAQALSQIDALNKFYNFQDPDVVVVPSVFQNLIADCNVHFCIAQFDEMGQPTTGIIRHQFANATWNTQDDVDNILKPATIWDPNTYLNIWSVRMGGTATGTLAGDGVLAYSSFPGFGSPDQDGVVARYTNIGTTSSVPASFRKGKTVTHELGHWFGLLHVWGLQPGCGGLGDFIDDTPEQADANYGCPAFPHITCNNGPNGDMFVNYMDYTNEDCNAMFTIDQALRMHSTLDGTRTSIKAAASACFYSLDAAVVKVVLPVDTVCSLNFTPSVVIKNAGLVTISSGKFYFQMDGGSVQIINWNGSLATQQEEQVNLPLQSVTAGAHTFDITFGNVNGQPSDNFAGNNNKSVSFYAYDGGVAASLPFTETFENFFPPSNWSIYNPNNDNTWIQNANTGGYAASSYSASINNKNYTSNPNKRKDALITDVYDFTSMPYPELKFDVAYARYSATRSDSLNIYYSLDCGSNWIKIWNQWGSQLATAPDTTAEFIPDPTQWKTVSVPLTSVGPQNKVSFKFENVTGWGNVLYLDNINIQNNPGLSVNDIPKSAVKLFPNPASNFAAVRMPHHHSFTRLQLLNTLGEQVYSSLVNDESVIFPVHDLPCGLYFVRLSGNSVSETQKLLINR